MLYRKILEKFRRRGVCPFDDLDKRFVILENKYAYLIPARAPYVKHHLIVLPKRHVVTLNKLRGDEKRDILDLIVAGIRILRKKYPAVEVEYKEGNLKAADKTIPHLHFHLLPRRGRALESDDKRTFLSDKAVIKEVKELKKW